MGQTLRFWGVSPSFPKYEVSDMGEIRKVDDDYKYRLPHFWGKLDSSDDPQWLVTLRDEEDREFTVPVYEVTDNADISWIGKYEN